MDCNMSCPVCGNVNIRTYYTEEIGLVEEYYDCDNCGYFIRMCYSSPWVGICVPEGKTKEEIIEKYGEIIKKNKLEWFDTEYVM